MRTPLYSFYHVCTHCLKVWGDHADNKCLFESTWFSPVACLLCKSKVRTPSTTAVVEGLRYFLCAACDTKSLRSEAIYTDFLAYYLSSDIKIMYWRTGNAY